MKVLIGLTLSFLSVNVMAADKCLKRKDLNKMYSSNIQYIENFGHVLAVHKDKFDRNLGYTIDVYAATKIPVKDKLTKKVSHYKNCLSLREKGIQGKYVYGTFTKSGVQLKQKGKINRISFVGN